jgi:hypothetical protein
MKFEEELRGESQLISLLELKYQHAREWMEAAHSLQEQLSAVQAKRLDYVLGQLTRTVHRRFLSEAFAKWQCPHIEIHSLKFKTKTHDDIVGKCLIYIVVCACAQQVDSLHQFNQPFRDAKHTSSSQRGALLDEDYTVAIKGAD